MRADLKLSAIFSLSVSGGVADEWYRVMLRPDEWVEDEIPSWETRVNARAKLFKLVWVSASGYYSSRSDGWSALEVNEPQWGADFSASADLFDRRLSFYLNFHDIFNSERWGTISVNPYAPSTSSNTTNSQCVTFGVTLRFGKMELGDSSKEGIQGGGQKGGK